MNRFHVHLKIDYVRFRLDDLSSPLPSESKINLSTFDGAEYRLADLTRFLESVKERDLQHKTDGKNY